MRTILSFLFVLVCKLSFAQTSPPTNLEGAELRSWLKENWHTAKHTELGYSEARRQMYSQIDVREDGRVYCVYTGYSQAAENTTFLDPINTEHTVPQSFFGESEPMKSDIHHLFPTHGAANSARLNYAFGDIPDQLTDIWYGSETENSFVESTTVPEALTTFSESEAGRFEPREDHKGDVARAIFYYYTMYPGTASDISRIVVGGKVEALYAWHLEDPVSDWEIQRNNRIETAQGNRNPYIDYPELACRAFNLSCNSGYVYLENSLPLLNAYKDQASATFSISLAGINIAEPVSIVADSGFYLTENGTDYVKTVTLNPETLNEQVLGVRFDTSGVEEGNYSAVLEAQLNGESLVLDTLKAEVIAAEESQLLAFEGFDDGNWELRGWEVISKSSDRNWGYTEEGLEGSPGIEMNGYNGNAGSDDWLISPELTIADGQTFMRVMAYSEYGGTDALTVLVSENFTEGSDPATTQWQELPVSLPSGGSSSWQAAEGSMTSYAGKNVRIAFHYQADGSYPSWVLDNFSLQKGEIPYSATISPAYINIPANTDSVLEMKVQLERAAEREVQIEVQLNGLEDLPVAINTTPALEESLIALTISKGESEAIAMVELPAMELNEEQSLSFTIQEGNNLRTTGNASSTVILQPQEEVVQGIDETDLKEWQIGPNPTAGTLYVKSQTKQLASVQLISATGQKFTGLFPDASGQLSLAQLPAGMYVLLLQDTNGKTSQIRIIKQ